MSEREEGGGRKKDVRTILSTAGSGKASPRQHLLRDLEERGQER